MIELPYIDWSLSSNEIVAALAATRHFIECPAMVRHYGERCSAGLSCVKCGYYQMRCCRRCCSAEEENHGCHRYSVVYVDGACPDNGYADARSGIGYALGATPEAQFSLPITEEIDPGQKRTNQRAELLAGLYGLLALEKHERNDCNSPWNRKRTSRDTKQEAEEDQLPSWVVATDSEYLVKGMADLVPV